MVLCRRISGRHYEQDTRRVRFAARILAPYPHARGDVTMSETQIILFVGAIIAVVIAIMVVVLQRSASEESGLSWKDISRDSTPLPKAGGEPPFVAPPEPPPAAPKPVKAPPAPKVEAPKTAAPPPKVEVKVAPPKP